MIGFGETSFEDLVLQPSVEVDGLTGSAQVRVEVRLSPGRDGFGPRLALAYDSGAGNSPYGLGWSLAGVPAIGIDTRRRLPTYHDQDGYVHAGGTALAPVLRRQGTGWAPVVDSGPDWVVQRYRARVDRAFDRFERWVERSSGRAHWRQRDRAGVVRVFGAAA